MRKLLAIGSSVLLVAALAGCSSNQLDESTPKPPATVNNSAPAAATAGAAPPITDTPTPGEMKLGGKRMTPGGPGGPPAAGGNN